MANATFPSRKTLDGLANNGFTYANRYEVEITIPKKTDQSTRELNIRCESISIPGRNLRTVGDFNIYGPPIEVVQGNTFGEVSASFYLSNDMSERILMEEWQNTVINPETYDLSYYKEYTGGLKVFLLDRDKDERRIYGVELFEVYPKAIEVIALSHASTNTINKLGVSFQYRNWKRLSV